LFNIWQWVFVNVFVPKLHKTPGTFFNVLLELALKNVNVSMHTSST